MRALVVHPGWLGDTVFLGPAVRALAASRPGVRVGVVVTPRGAPVARLLPGCDEVFVYDKRGADAGVRGLLRVGLGLRAFRPDLALVVGYGLRSGLVARLSGAPRRIGYAPFCTERLPLERGAPFVDRALALAARAGAKGDPALRLHVPGGDEARAAAAMLRGSPRPVLGLVPGAEWATKRWGEERYAALARRAVERGGSALLLGGPADRAAAARIAALAGVPVLDSTGNRIDEAVALLAHCDAVVGGDTGLVHCARALGRPAVVLFGPTSAARHRLSSRERAIALDLPCQPCHAHGPERCPLGHHRCMRDLGVDGVWREVSALLAGEGAPAGPP